VSLVDLLPTIAEWLGEELETGLEGRSLVGQIDGSDFLRPRPVFAQRRPRLEEDGRRGGWVNSRMLMVRGRRLKLILNSHQDDELYDLLSDPLELNNVAEENVDDLDRIRRYLEQREENLQASGQEDLRVPEAAFAQELEALGYVTGLQGQR
jgi:arylsulfatase A-like enzyme